MVEIDRLNALIADNNKEYFEIMHEFGVAIHEVINNTCPEIYKTIVDGFGASGGSFHKLKQEEKEKMVKYISSHEKIVVNSVEEMLNMLDYTELLMVLRTADPAIKKPIPWAPPTAQTIQDSTLTAPKKEGSYLDAFNAQD